MLELQFDTVGALRDAVLAGEPADVVILSEAGMAALAKAAKIDERTGRARQHGGGAGGAQGCGGARLSRREALRQSLLERRSIAYADPARGATAGAHFARVLERLGIAGEIAPRVTILPFGGDVIRAVAEGRFAIGVSQSSEIVAHDGVALAGRLPPPYDHQTRLCSGDGAGAGPGARAFLAMLQAAAGRAALAAIGFTEP